MILVIDDSAANSVVLKFGLGERYNLKFANSPNFAADILTREQIGAIIVNADMESSSGIYILRRIKNLQSVSKIHTIVIAANLGLARDECFNIPEVSFMNLYSSKEDVLMELSKYHLPEKTPEDAPEDENKKCILVVDDDEIALRTLLFQLGHDYTVITASSGQEAFEKMASRRPDAILLDVRMPGMDGITFFKKMKAIAEYREIPTIFQTGVADVETVCECISIGSDGYVIKPVQKNMIIEKIEEVLGKELSKKHILIIEPDNEICKILKNHLEEDFKISIESSISFALYFLGKQAPDLILLDDENPCSAYYKIRAKSINSPIILLSRMCNKRTILEKCISLGASGLINNPYNKNEIMENIKFALDIP
ncbi:MAG: response regulator [Oscillospiraceae bacterium]|nr:response regulator [Oscillospiraceae bacterium]